MDTFNVSITHLGAVKLQYFLIRGHTEQLVGWIPYFVILYTMHAWCG